MDDLLNAAPCGFLSFSDNGIILLANATVSEWLGYEPEELTGRSIETILSVGGRIFYQTHIFPLLKLQGRVEEVYFSLKPRSGEALAVLANAARREREGVFASDCIFLPMRQRREFEDELLQAKKIAEEASQAKAKFLSMMSHELRTPLNAILGFGQLLEMDGLEPLQAESVEHILKSGRHLLELINEVLDISRIEAGHLDISPQPVPVEDVMSEAFEMAEPLAGQAGIGMRLLSGPYDESFVRADRGRLRQVLLNLLANGIKYNRAGGNVTIGCAPAADGSNGMEGIGARLRFEVRDTGPGIAPHKLGKLFVPFERLGAENSEIEGTGLGLALCKRLAEAMEGQIGVHSIEGEGSCFWIELPLAPNPAATAEGTAKDSEEAASHEAPVSTALVVCIEDNASNLKLIQRILGQRPAVRLLPAVTGEAGLQLARAHAPNLILLDLQLPDMMGDAVLRHLQEDERTRDIPVVMLSADATPQQIDRLLKAGVREYLTKPLNVKQFLSVLDAMLEEQNIAPVAS